MTEDEAKTKWCPMSRTPYVFDDPAITSCNRNASGEIDDADKCIGSHCMMWRWTDKIKGRGVCGLAGSE